MEKEIQNLKGQLRNVKILNLFLIVISGFIIFSSFIEKGQRNAVFEELTVGTLNIAGPDSVKRMILTHQIGDGPFNGTKLKRNVPPKMAGMIYCNPNGDEIGGKGWTGNEVSSFAINAYDYSGIPLEAIGFNRIQNEKMQSAEFIVLDNPDRSIKIDKDQLVKEINTASPGEEVEKLTKQAVDRVRLGVKNHVASLVLSDKNGNPRIELVVDENNQAKIVVLNEKGKVLSTLPN